MLQVVLTGLVTGLALIIAVGAQNAFLLRQGIRGEQVLPIVLTCLISDVVAITACVFGLGIVLAGLLVWRVDFIDFSVPVGQLVVFAIAAIIVGIIAAIFPARRAAHLNPLQALQYE